MAMLTPGTNYADVYANFRWRVPARYNIARNVCDRHARGRRLALIDEAADGTVTRYTFADFKRLSNRCANGLRALGIGRGDRVGLLLSQSPDLAVAHLAVYKLGAIALPLFTLFAPDGLRYRLADSTAKAVVTDGANLHKILEIRDQLPALETVLVTDGDCPDGTEDFRAMVERGSESFAPVATNADDPALVIYTSGTTGPPKGALHAQRVVLGHVPGLEFPHDFFPRPGDLLWSPADWAWIGGLLATLMPCWHHGMPILVHRAGRFDPEEAFALMARHGVRNTLLPATALKLMRQVPDPRARFGAAPRTVSSGGEPLGAELLDWGREALGVTINEIYGQTEANLLVGTNAAIMEARPGSMGRAMPGHEVEVVDTDGQILPVGETGVIAARRGDPVMFLEYWRNEEATMAKFAGDWCLTGDLGRKDEDGYFWFMGREDDVITSGGYRIGPTEIEDCLLGHAAVADAAAVGVPDPVRGEVVKAYLVLQPGAAETPDLAAEIQNFARARLGAHEYPRQIEFLTGLPVTATGKIMRRVLRQRDAEQRAGATTDEGGTDGQDG